MLSDLIKLADIATELQPHQKRPVERIQKPDQPGLIVAHGLGSGKTLTSIAMQEALKMPSTVAVPAALQENYAKERRKHLTGESQEADIQSLQNIAAKKRVPDKKVLIVDEAHRAREPGSETYQTLKKNKAEKRIMLTGSPFYNHPADIAPLVNIVSGQTTLPVTRPEFSKRYIVNEEVKPSLWGRLRGVKPGSVEKLNPREAGPLSKILNKWVDYYPGSTSHEDFPQVNRQDVKVPMSPRQLNVYDTLMGQAPAWVSWKVRRGLPPSKAESQQLNAFLGGVRQISNTTAPFQPGQDAQEPKIQRAFEELKKTLDANPQSKAVVYSNFLQAGLDPYKRRLQAANIPYGEFTGEMPKLERDELVRQYNENKIRALLLSSAGGEGLDLKGTRLLQVLEPHWNSEKIKQVEGRGARFKSHADLPEADRNMLVQRYLATRSPQGLLEKLRLKNPGGSVDEYLARRSAEKEQLIQQFKRLLRTERPQPPPQQG